MFYALNSIAPQKVCEGYHARIYHGERITFAVLEVEPNAPLPMHSHDNEQVGLLVQGSLSFTIDGVKRTLGAGEGWVIPSNAPHDAVAGAEGAVVIETWAPPRTDFLQLQTLAAAPAQWPPTGQ
jgi:quercetin dioxygenase-like cupin family protein